MLMVLALEDKRKISRKGEEEYSLSFDLEAEIFFGKLFLKPIDKD